jgi:transcription elongation factor Elf1
MFDLSKEKIDFNCPECGRNNVVTLSQVANQATITCIGCRERINLKDNGGSARRTINDSNKAMRDLESAFKKLGK